MTCLLFAIKYNLENRKEIKDNGEEGQRNHEAYAARASSTDAKLQRLNGTKTSPLIERHYVFTYYFVRWLMDHARRGNYDVTIENVTDDLSCLSVAGPHSRAVLSKLTSTDMSNAHFKFLTIKDIDLAGVPVRAMRISYTGEFSGKSTAFEDALTVILTANTCISSNI